MKTETINIKEAFSNAWQLFKSNWWFLVLVGLVTLLVTHASAMNPILSFFVGVIVSVSLSTLCLEMVSGKAPSLDHCVKNLKSPILVLNMALIMLVCSLIIGLGFIAFIIPGIYLLTRLWFFPFYVVEHQHKKFKELFMGTLLITRGNFFTMFGFVLVAVILNILGALFFGVGTLVTIPLTYLASAHVYKKATDHMARVHHAMHETKQPEVA